MATTTGERRYAPQGRRSGRRLIPALAVTLALLGSVPAPSATAASDTWCGPALGGTWDGLQGRCSLTVVSNMNALMTITLSLPVDLLDDALAGPVLADYARNRGTTWRKTGQLVPRDNTAFAESTVYSHSPTVKTVVIHERFQTYATDPNDAYRTFTFDLARGKLLSLADLFAPGVDPVAAITSVARPFVADALDKAPPAHGPGVYPFYVEKWEPQPDGSGYSGDYRAWALTPDELILYMPDQPMSHEVPAPAKGWQWSMNGGIVTVHVPLAPLRPQLAPQYQ